MLKKLLKNKHENKITSEEETNEKNENDIEMRSIDIDENIMSDKEEIVQKNISFSNIEGMIHLNGKEVSMIANDDRSTFYIKSNGNTNKNLVIRVEVISLIFSLLFVESIRKRGWFDSLALDHSKRNYFQKCLIDRILLKRKGNSSKN